ncbi:uncharacterized protein LOC125573786 [Nematostella vectensis]|uniref:uncharacterized protein LOC125573786 n=1 Tax=Nematostella vectensis TaxID=45351 RepID=UPI0020779494|nr:uncharacterized protein LOC125573786 [Nematostella vectensis]
MFCSFCGKENPQGAKFCCNCGKDTQEPRPGPSGVSNEQFGMKSYVNFKTTFGRPSKATLVGKGKKRKVEEDPAKEVVISIGLKVWDEDEEELKEKKRKRLPLKVPQNATYALLLEKAKEKWQNFRNDLYDPESEYGLVLEDNQHAQFIPGTGKKVFFSLNLYKEELVTDYKRVTIYLCEQVWLTGQKHQEKGLSITVRFDHCCKERYPKHTVCYPLVGACGKEVTFLVAHMLTSESFKDILLTGCCKGQSFSRA